MSISIRPLLVPTVAFATVGAVAFGPMLVAPPALTQAASAIQAPVIHVADIQLAGFSLDLYNALNGWAQFGVQVLQDLFFWNPAIAAQIGTLYTTLQPIVAAVVTFIDTLTQGPTDILGALTSIVTNLLPAFGIALPALSAAAVGKSSAPQTAARTAVGQRAAVAPAPELSPEELPVVAPAEVPVPARANRGELHRAAKVAVIGARQAARSAAVDVVVAPEEFSSAVDIAAPTPARASRGAAARAAQDARGAVTAGADAAS